MKKRKSCFCSHGFFEEFKKHFDHCLEMHNMSSGEDDLYGPWDHININQTNNCLIFLSIIEQCIEDGTMFIFGDALLCLHEGEIADHIHEVYKGRYDNLFWPQKGYVKPDIYDMEKEHIFDSFIMEIKRQRIKEGMTIEESLDALEWIIKDIRRRHNIPFKCPEN